MAHKDHPWDPGNGFTCTYTGKKTRFVMTGRNEDGTTRGMCEHCGATSTSLGELLDKTEAKRRNQKR